jgi:DNA-binding NtrC family response regulator
MNNKSHVLLIDDEPEILDLLRIMLITDGFEVSTADCGEAALKKLGEVSYDAVVCDYMMPRMNGITLLKQVRKNKDYTPFVFFSGNAEHTHEVKMKSLGAYEFIQKPHVELLADVLTKTIKHNETIKIFNPDQGEENDFMDLVFTSNG